MLAPKEPLVTQIEDQVTHLGSEILADVHNKLGFKDRIEDKLFEISARFPKLKAAMFRLVDVMPMIRSDQELALHIREYIEPPLNNIHPWLARLLRLACGPTIGPLTSRIARWSVTKMARRFIAGSDGKRALSSLQKLRTRSLAFTVDLLGEYSVGEAEALQYLGRYQEVLSTLAEATKSWPQSEPLIPGHIGERSPICISVKLSALYSQCDVLNLSRSVDILSERLATLAQQALSINATLYVDAEDSATNQIIYRTFMQVFSQPKLRDIAYPGIVVQAYARNAAQIIGELLEFAKRRGNPIAVRLVKGAYWDSETIIANQNGFASPLYARKQSSDANYEALSRLLIDNHEYLYPAFGSHNVRSLTHACCYAQQRGLNQCDFELQMLYGMARPIAKAFVERGYLVRLYVALGELLPGMGYLVRRLLENTSNESFLRSVYVSQDKSARLLRQPQFLD